MASSSDQVVPVRPRNVIVFVNPHSGPGKALEIFKERVEPIFAEAGLNCKIIVTGKKKKKNELKWIWNDDYLERANHAYDFVQTMSPQEWDEIVIDSGDGLIYEVINGLLQRADREEVLKIPIAIIPGGSGNALCSSVMHYYG